MHLPRINPGRTATQIRIAELVTGQPGASRLATAVLAGLVLNAAAGWRWADPAAGYILVSYAVREVREIFSDGH